MVPLYPHRCLPAGRGTYGHRVLSMRRTGVSYCGSDPGACTTQESNGPPHREDVSPWGRPWLSGVTWAVAFWWDLVD